MNDKIDQGDIVRQKYFAINDNDTAFTLNLRCFEYAIETFQDLLIDIENDKLVSKKQQLSKQIILRRITSSQTLDLLIGKLFLLKRL